MSASFSIVIEGKGTFTASIADPEASVTVGTNTPASFTAEVAPVGPAGATGATGPAGVVAATAPITYNSGTQTVAMDTEYFVRSPLTGATDGQILSYDEATTRPLWIDNSARTLFSTVRNETGATLTAGTVVYISGAAGNKALVTKAQANSEAASSRTFAVIAASIANNQNGTAIVAGELGKLDTTAFAEGATLYLSPTTAGTFTTTKPTAPNHIVYIGTVTRVHANQGTIEVRIQNGSELDEMADVLFTSKANNDLLVYESSSSLWKNKSFSTLDLATQSWVTSQGYLTAPYNPFDQTLNTSSTVQFAGVSISGLTGYVVGMSSSSVYAINTTSGQKGAFLNGDGLNLLGSGSGIIFADSTTQTTAATTPDLTPYATLASPTFTGDPKAPTPTAGDNDTSIATTAFVNTYCPSASTTVEGKVELATTAEAIAGTDTTRAVTSEGLRSNVNKPSRLAIGAAVWTGATSGTGASGGQNFNAKSAAAPTTAVGYGSVYYSLLLTNGNASYNSTIDWSKKNEFTFQYAKGVNTADPNTVGRLVIGKPSFSGVAGDPTARAVGVRNYRTGFLELIVHDGTTLTAVATSLAVNSTFVFDLRIVSEGNGTVTLYNQGTQVATTTAGPTLATGSGNNVILEAQNLAIISTTRMQILCANFTADFGK